MVRYIFWKPLVSTCWWTHHQCSERMSSTTTLIFGGGLCRQAVCSGVGPPLSWSENNHGWVYSLLSVCIVCSRSADPLIFSGETSTTVLTHTLFSSSQLLGVSAASLPTGAAKTALAYVGGGFYHYSESDNTVDRDIILFIMASDPVCINVLCFYVSYLHVCPQSMKEEGVEVEWAAPAQQLVLM